MIYPHCRADTTEEKKSCSQYEKKEGCPIESCRHQHYGHRCSFRALCAQDIPTGRSKDFSKTIFNGDKV